MMDRLWSTPPHTLGAVSPACLATSTNWTGEVVGAATAACSRSLFLHCQSGVARASVRLLPSRNRDEPRKRRRGNIIACDDYRDSSGRYFGERMGNHARAFFDRDDGIDGYVCQLIDLAAGPGDHQRLDLGSLAQAKMNARIGGRHIAATALGLLHMHKSFRSQSQYGAGAIPVGFCPDQLHLQPMIGIASVIAQQLRIITAVVDGNVDVAIVVEIRS